MVSRGRTATTAGTSATRSPTTSTAATRTATTKAAPSKAATSTAAKSKPTTTRKTITQSSAGQAAQASFKQAVSSAAQAVGVDFGVPTLKTTIQETETEIITVTEKPEIIEQIIEEPVIEEQIIEEQIIEEPIIELPELLPEVFAEEQIRLSADIIQIINDIENGVILVPDWFYNNIEWVKNGHISEHEFRTAYNYLAEQQIAHPPEQNLAITDNMVTQRLDNFSIINGRAVGQITFTATENFNPNYYGKNLVNIIQFKTPNGVNILPFIKQNTLRFTATERDEVIQYDEGMENNTRATLESFVWSDVTTPTAFSKKLSYEISETEAPKPVGTTGIMGAGVSGAIGILILLGFIADSRRKK